MIDAIAGGGMSADFRDGLNEARSLHESLEEEFAALESEKVIALHPKIAADYRCEVETLTRALGGNQIREAREHAIPRLRVIIDSIMLAPAEQGRGGAIEVTGRFARMIELATGEPLTFADMLAVERVKGIEPSS